MRSVPVLVCLLLVLVTVAGCGKDEEAAPPPPPTSAAPITLELGEPTTVAEATVSSRGGVVRVSKPGDPLDGLEIRISQGRRARPGRVKVSHRPIRGHTGGETFQMGTPLIRIDGGEEYTDEPMLVKIPVKVPAGHFGMGFFYDAENGRLEGIPTLRQDKDSITVATRHFSLMLVLIAKVSRLHEHDFDSGFRPGTDDWRHENLGTALSSGGICAGMSLTAKYYFTDKRLKGEPTLCGLHDNNGKWPTPLFDIDDADAIRLGSVVTVHANHLLRRLARLAFLTSDEVTYFNFAWSIATTGRPQYIGITGKDGGHAMVVYRADKGKLHVADPNFPGDTGRTIDLVKGRFESYASGTTKYTGFMYLGEWALIPHRWLQQQWEAFETGSIGRADFPPYTLEFGKPSYVGAGEMAYSPASDGFVTSEEKLHVRLGGLSDPTLVVYDAGGHSASPDSVGGGQRSAEIPLKAGPNELGFHVLRSVRTPTGQHYDWVDFRWLIVTRVPEELRNLPGTSVVILFDTSGSMKETIAGGKRKIDVAKDAAKAVLEKKTAATNLEWALFTFRGSRPNLAVPFQEDTRALLEAVSHLAPDANTPLAATMRQAGEYALRAARYNSVRIIILSDGQETCGGDPAAEARRLKELFEGHEDYKPISRNPREPEAPAGMIASESPSILGEVLLAQTGPPRDETKTPRRPSGKRLEVTVIGLDIKDAAEEKKLKAIAEAGGGRYLKVDRVEELAPAIEAAVEGGSEEPFDEVSAVVMLCILLESALLATMVSLWVYHRRKRPLASVVPLVKLRPADAIETAATEEEKCLDHESA